jgi:hypothetical protein
MGIPHKNKKPLLERLFICIFLIPSAQQPIPYNCGTPCEPAPGMPVTACATGILFKVLM